jgi:hypothetical protein
MPDKKPQPPRDKNQPFPKDEPRGTFKGLLAKLLLFAVLFLVTASMVAYSLRIQVWPWAWTSENWKGYLTFSQEKAKAAGDEIAAYDWANLKTKITDKTKSLWNDAPEVGKRIEEKLGGARSSTPAKPGEPATSVPASGQADVTASHRLALETMREGIGHYRKSPDDPRELLAAKKCFEDAAQHFEKALKDTNDDAAKGEIKKDLENCNKYLEDCRAREKS